MSCEIYFAEAPLRNGLPHKKGPNENKWFIPKIRPKSFISCRIISKKSVILLLSASTTGITTRLVMFHHEFYYFHVCRSLPFITGLNRRPVYSEIRKKCVIRKPFWANMAGGKLLGETEWISIRLTYVRTNWNCKSTFIPTNLSLCGNFQLKYLMKSKKVHSSTGCSLTKLIPPPPNC